MPNKAYGLTYSTWSAQMVSALISRYGAGITIYFSDVSNIVFSCPAISNKVIKVSIIQLVSGNDTYQLLQARYGDAWTSGSTITNPISFMVWNYPSEYSSAQYLFISITLILGDNFILCWGDGSRSQMFLIGKLTNGKYLTMGLLGKSSPLVGVHGYLTDSLIEIEIPTISFAFRDNGKFVIHPLLFSQNGQLLLNSDGSYATIPFLFNVAYTTHTLAPAFYVSPSKYFYNITGIQQLYTSLFCELTP